MKFKATIKSLRNDYHRIISIGYCDAQYLLNYESPIAYSAGVYGWACDYYDIDDVLISTGYSPLAEKNTKRDYSIVRRYDSKAEKIIHDYDSGLTGEEKRTKVRGLLAAFVEEMKI